MTSADSTLKPAHVLTSARVEALLETLYRDVEGYRLSHRSRARLGLTARSYVYGETLVPAFEAAMAFAAPRAGERFLDLGAGVGRALVVAALRYDFAHCHGLELLPELVDAGRDALAALPSLLTDAERPRASRCVLEARSFLVGPLPPADVVYVMTAAFEPGLVDAIGALTATLAAGTRLVAVGEPVPSVWMRPLGEVEGEMGWGATRTFISVRT